jgi:hypothetical protein
MNIEKLKQIFWKRVVAGLFIVPFAAYFTQQMDDIALIMLMISGFSVGLLSLYSASSPFVRRNIFQMGVGLVCLILPPIILFKSYNVIEHNIFTLLVIPLSIVITLIGGFFRSPKHFSRVLPETWVNKLDEDSTFLTRE